MGNASVFLVKKTDADANGRHRDRRRRVWSGRRDSNPLPTAWEAVALPGELLPLLFFFFANMLPQLGIPTVNVGTTR